jgi:hypothetical protein
MSDNPIFTLNPLLVLDRSIKLVASMMLTSLILGALVYLIIIYIIGKVETKTINDIVPNSTSALLLYFVIGLSTFLYMINIGIGTYEYWRGLTYAPNTFM